MTNVDPAAIAAAYPLISPHVRRTPVVQLDGPDFGLDAGR